MLNRLVHVIPIFFAKSGCILVLEEVIACLAVDDCLIHRLRYLDLSICFVVAGLDERIMV